MKSKKVMPRHRKEIIRLREEGNTWPEVSKLVGFSRATVQKVYKEDAKPPEPPLKPREEVVPELPKYEEAKVLGPVPNPRLMRIFFKDREGVGICVKRPQDNHRPNSMVLVKKVEGNEELYRLV
jgi:predicted DNA-binding transcriptional regulator AlpA